MNNINPHPKIPFDRIYWIVEKSLNNLVKILNTRFKLKDLWEVASVIQNLNCKFKTFGFLNILTKHTYTLQSNYLAYYLISTSNKTTRKRQQTIFYALHSSVSDLKSVIALSSRGGHCPPCPPVYGLCVAGVYKNKTEPLKVSILLTKQSRNILSIKKGTH